MSPASRVFISYRHKERAKAELLHRLLKERGVDSWYDAMLDAGDEWRKTTASALVAADVFVLLFSKSAAQSDEIAKELAAATLQKKLVVPVRLDNIQPKGSFLYELASRNWFDAYDDTDARLEVLADRLAASLKIEPDAPAAKAGVTPVFRRPAIVAAFAVLAVALGAAIYLLTRTAAHPAQDDSLRVAFFGFTAEGDDPIVAEVASTATEEGFKMMDRLRLDLVVRSDTTGPQPKPALERAEDLGARFAVTGEVRREADELKVTARMIDVPTRTTIFQVITSGKVARPLPVGYGGGARAASRSKCVVAYLMSYGKRAPDPTTVPLIGRGCVSDVNVDVQRELMLRNPDGVIEAAELAYSLIWRLPGSPESMRPHMVAEADAALAHAELKGPDDFATAVARVALAIHHNRKPVGWVPQLEDVTKRPPRPEEAMFYARANAHAGWAMLVVGRNADAERYYRIARDSDPGLPLWAFIHAFTRALIAQYGLEKSFEELLATRVSTGFSWELTLSAAIFMNATDFENVIGFASNELKGAVPCYRELRASLQSTDSAARLAGARKADACLGILDSPHINIQAQSMLGNLDRAFEIADRADFTSYIWRYFPPLFLPSTRAMRADARFLPLTQKLGYYEYWQRTGARPDACATEDEKDIPLCVALRAAGPPTSAPRP